MEGMEGITNFLLSKNEVFAILDKDGKFVFFNDNAPAILETSKENLELKSLFEIIYELDIERTRTALQKVLKGEAQTFENRVALQAGDEQKWLSWSVFLSGDKLYATGRDVSSAHRDSSTLQVAQNRLRLLHQATSNPTQTLGEKIERVLNLGNLQLGMDTAIVGRVQGTTLSVFRSKTPDRSLFADRKEFDLKQTFDSITMQAGNLIGIQNVSHSVYDEHPAHTVMKMEAYLAVPLYIEGEIFGVLSFSGAKPKSHPFQITDYDFVRLVGQWISSSLALLLANEQIAYTASIVSSSDDAIIGQTKDGVITTWNVGAEKLLGYTPDEIIGKQYSLLIPDDLLLEGENILKQLLKGKAIQHYDTLSKKKDGTVVDVSSSISPIYNENHEIVGASAVLRDITREKQIDRAKTEFVSLASHQLRTPLSAINWYSELLRDGAAGRLSKQQKEFVDEIFEGNQRMVRLVNELLNVSRIDFGNFTIEPIKLDVVEISRSVVKELVPSIQKKKLNVKEEYSSKEIQYLADPNILRIVIQNLISNAVKYTPDKGKIIVKVLALEEQKELLIQVADTGYGIPKDQQDQIFSKLFRADNVLAMDTVGTGLGLYVLKAIVEESGGSVGFVSEIDEGTTFTVTLPLSGMKKKEGGKGLSQVTP